MKRPARRSRFVLRAMQGFGLLAFLLAACYGIWLYQVRHRSQPRPLQRMLFQGVEYFREPRVSPRPIIIDVVRVRLDTPGLGFLVTPGEPGKALPLRAQTTSHFLLHSGAQLAVNADFFYPWHSHNLLDYYPHVGDPCTVEGFAASRGVAYSTASDKRHFPTLYLSARNHASFAPTESVYNAVSGSLRFLNHGSYVSSSYPYNNELQPRTALGLDAAGENLLIVVVDGRQPNYSEGVTLAELAALMRQYGVTDAINLDGGGSTELVMRDRRGKAVLLNSPIDCGIPGRERPIANHLALFASPLAPSR